MIYFIGDGGHASVCREALANHMKRRKPYVSMVERWFVAIGDNKARKDEAIAQGGPWATIIHRKAHVSQTAKIGEGTVILEGAIVQAHSVIGKHCIINANATVTHHCVVEDFAHIAPGAHLCGGVEVGEGALVGVGVGLEPGCKIPAWSIVKITNYEITLANS